MTEVAALPLVARRRALVHALRRNPLMLTGAAIALLLVLAAVLAPVIAPHPADAGTATNPVASLLPPSGRKSSSCRQIENPNLRSWRFRSPFRS